MQGQVLVSINKPPRSAAHLDRLIKPWVLRFALNAARQMDAPTSAAVVALWREAFAHLDFSVLEEAFQRTLATCKFFPAVADILGHVDRADAAGLEEEAERAWRIAFDHARLWCGDRRAPRLPEKIMRAIDAAGGLAWIESCPLPQLQWAQKKFLEAFRRADELGRSGDLITRGEARRILADHNAADLAERHALPARAESRTVDEGDGGGMAVALEGLRAVAADAPAPRPTPRERDAYTVHCDERRRAELLRQAEQLAARARA